MSKYLHAEDVIRNVTRAELFLSHELRGTGLRVLHYLFLSAIQTYMRDTCVLSVHARSFFAAIEDVYPRTVFCAFGWRTLHSEGYLRKVARGHYVLTEKAYDILQRIEPTRLMIARTGHK